MRRVLFVTLILCLWLAGGLRFYRLGAQSLWNDEGLSLGLAASDVPTILRSAAADIHPPGYYLLLKVWHGLTGDTEFALRSLSALAGIALVALLYRLGRVYFDRPAALGAAALGALNPFLVYYSQETRMYALTATLAAGSFLLFSLWLRSSRPPASPFGDRKLAISYCLVTAAGLYTHYAFAFVILAENLAALGGLMAHGRTQATGQRHTHGPSRRAVWLGLQAATLILFLPWLPTSYHQLTTWPAATEHPSFLTALPDLWRYLVFGRTVDTNMVWAGLAGAAILLLLALRRRGQTITPLIWLLVPSALTLAFGLLTDAFSKFLVVAAPAACLLLGHGLAGLPSSLFTVVPRATEESASRRYGRRLAWILEVLVWWAAVAAVGAGLYVSLNNLYFNPAYARDDYRGIARYVESVYRPADAIITIAPNQVETFAYYHRTGAQVFPLPHARPLDPAETAVALDSIAASHPRVFVLFWGDDQADPDHFVENWLNTHAFKAGETWYGQVRLATYALAAPAAAPAARSGSGARFGDHITLQGYSLQSATLKPGDILQLTLFWQTDAPLDARYKVFVHLYAEPNQPPLAQQDGEPGGGLAPSNTWAVGAAIPDNHGVLIPGDLPPGRYQLMIGLYELFTGDRQPITLDNVPQGDRLTLETITIQ
jgi:mannosyltransferase